MQPDTLIPDPSNPQSWNRYSYGLNSPIRYIDPTGHTVDCATYDTACKTAKPLSPDYILKKYNVTVDKRFTDNQKFAIVHGVVRVAYRFAETRDESAAEVFTAIFDGGINFTYGELNTTGDCASGTITSGGCTSSSSQINFWSMASESSNDMFAMVGNVIHEIGHAYSNQLEAISKT